MSRSRRCILEIEMSHSITCTLDTTLLNSIYVVTGPRLRHVFLFGSCCGLPGRLMTLGSYYCLTEDFCGNKKTSTGYVHPGADTESDFE